MCCASSRFTENQADQECVDSKKRGKRPTAPPKEDDDAAAKRAKLDSDSNPYLLELRKASGSVGLREEGAQRQFLK